jgi:hypothetical protein
MVKEMVNCFEVLIKTRRQKWIRATLFDFCDHVGLQTFAQMVAESATVTSSYSLQATSSSYEFTHLSLNSEEEAGRQGAQRRGEFVR